MNPASIQPAQTAARATRILKGAGTSLGAPALQDLSAPASRRRTTARPAVNPQASESCEPSVELVQLGGTTRALQVRCSCGEELTIELDYEGDPAS